MTDFDCLKYPNFMCDLLTQSCVHKDIFPILGSEFVGLIILICLMTLSTMGGIGGGGAVVPFTMMFFGFTTKEAIAISGFSIFICSITRYFYTLSEKHPEKDAVIIDYGLATIMLPAVMMGSMIGVLANQALPGLILQGSLTLLLIFLTIQAGFKARQIYQKENAKMASVNAKKKD